MVKACVVQGSILKKVVKVTKDVAAEGAKLVFSAAGFSLKATNHKLGAIVSVVLPEDAFDCYHCDRTVSIAVDLHCMFRIFHVTSDDDIITMEDFRGQDDVTFVIEDPMHDKISEFTMMKEISIDNQPLLHLLHISSEAEYHSIETLASIKMPSIVFARICSELADMGDHVTIKITEEEKAVRFITEGKLGTSIVVCRQNFDVHKPEEAVVIEMNETVSVTFSLRLINSFAKEESLSHTVTINFLRDMPSVVEYKIAQTGYARFYLHPSKEH